MIEGTWKRVAGLHVQDDGDIAVVWTAHDKDTDTIHLYDAAMFKQEIMAVIAEGLNARGRWIPIAYPEKAKEIAEELLKRGCNTLPEAYKETDAVREMTARDIQERMRSSRFKVDKRLQNWQDEFKTFYRDESQIPKGFPLMSATRHAIANLEWAKSNMRRRSNQRNYSRMAIV